MKPRRRGHVKSKCWSTSRLRLTDSGVHDRGVARIYDRAGCADRPARERRESDSSVSNLRLTVHRVSAAAGARARMIAYSKRGISAGL